MRQEQNKEQILGFQAVRTKKEKPVDYKTETKERSWASRGGSYGLSPLFIYISEFEGFFRLK